MSHWVAGHRAILGLVGLLAMAALFGLMAMANPGVGIIVALGVVWLLADGALLLSPYWKIVYREAPLRSASDGVSDLDEREHALRDRGHGLSYYLFFIFNLLLILAAWGMVDLYGLRLDGDALRALLIPYSAFAVSLPVILLEWFHPSGAAAADPDFEEE